MGSNPEQAWIFFQPYFYYCFSIVLQCEGRFHIHFFALSICLPDPRKTEVKVRARSFRQSDDEFEDEEISQGQIRQYFPETWIFMDDVVGFVNSFLDNISWLIMLMYNVDWISTRALKGGALMEEGRLIKGEGGFIIHQYWCTDSTVVEV